VKPNINSVEVHPQLSNNNGHPVLVGAIGNLMGATTTNPPHPTLPKSKKSGPCGCMLAHLIGCQEFLCLPLFISIFCLV